MTADVIDYNKFAIQFGGRKSYPRKKLQYHFPPIGGNIVLPILYTCRAQQLGLYAGAQVYNCDATSKICKVSLI